MIDKNTQSKLDEIVNAGIVISIAYGQCGDHGILWSSQVLTPQGKSFSMPIAHFGFDEAVDAAYLECKEFGWLKETK